MPIKAREIRERLKGRITPELSTVLEALAEEQSVVRQQQLDTAQAIDKITDIVMQFTTVAENMKSVIESMERKRDDNGEPHTH